MTLHEAQSPHSYDTGTVIRDSQATGLVWLCDPDDTLSKTVLHSQRERGRRQAGQKKNRLTHVKECSSKKGGTIDPTFGPYIVTKFRAGPLYHRDRSEWRALSSVASLLSPNDLYQSRKKSINEISH